MKPTPSDAFRSPLPRSGGKAPSLASLLRPMQAQLDQVRERWELRLSPMRAVDALAVWTESSEPEIRVLLLGVHQRSWADDRGPLPIAAVAERLGIPVQSTFSEDCLELTATSATGLLGMLSAARVVLVLIEGPIEPRDAAAIERAVLRGDSPLDVELRARLALFVEDDRAVTLHVRDRMDAARLVGANLRHYLAAVMQRSAHVIAEPQVEQVQRLLDRSGVLAIRPIETEVSSGSIDVGISTGGERYGPADASLIYDRPSDSWHDEP